MTPNNNLENQFRKKLNERNIRPSHQSWDRLDSMLEVAQKKKPKRDWPWIAIGWGAWVVFAILVLIIRANNITPTEDFVREESHKKMPSLMPEMWDDDEEFTISKKEFNQKTIPQDSFRVVQKTETFNDNNDINIDIHESVNQDILANTKIEVDTESNIYITAQDLLDHIKDEKHIATQNKKTTVTIDHKSLLYQAEMEVEQQYRKNAIDRFLQKSFDNVKVATLNKF